MNREAALAANERVLSRYLPKGTARLIAYWVVEFRVKFKITRPRDTKLGDYRPAGQGRPHTITVNGNLNPYSFLITTVHEFAHLGCHLKHGHTVAPHGAEWKGIYVAMLRNFLGTGTFPPDLEVDIKRHLDNPKASSCSCAILSAALARYDSKPGVLLQDFTLQTPFAFNGEVYEALEKRRTRYLCKRLADGKRYLISGRAKVEPVQGR
jgi:hypothetical protein